MSDTPDRELLRLAISRLETTGEIEYRGEFGAEITTFIPFACWLKSEGHLNGRRIVTYRGMRPYYYFLEEGEYAEKAARRAWLPPGERDWPSNSTYTATRQPWHVMPDYRARYRSEGLKFARPVLFIQNKFCVEWRAGPINFIPLNALELLFALSSNRFDVVYSRPREIDGKSDYAADENLACEYPDLAVARGFPGVMVLEDFCERSNTPYNLAKLQILAKAHLLIGVQGGGGHLLACFGDALMLMLHREGEEYPHAYAAGPYKYLASPPPVLMVARTAADFNRGASVIASAKVGNGDVTFDRKWLPAIKDLRL